MRKVDHFKMIKPRAILVCVDYSEILALTLPYNRHHFADVMVVTSPEDLETQRLAISLDCRVLVTDAFYLDGAIFNKFRALEEGLGYYGRDGWLCIMDADVAWPKMLPKTFSPRVGYLYAPYRRMRLEANFIPPESEWRNYTRHRQVREFAGFTQIFHGSDPALGKPPWHIQNHTHAGGGDSWFQNKWPEAKKIRPNWEVLHLGPAGKNWCGKSKESQEKLRGFLRLRRVNGNFDHEMI